MYYGVVVFVGVEVGVFEGNAVGLAVYVGTGVTVAVGVAVGGMDVWVAEGVPV